MIHDSSFLNSRSVGSTRPGAGASMRRPAASGVIPVLHHRVLGLPSGESDPVRIITAAQVRLRRWRRHADRSTEGMKGCGTVGRVQRIIQARDALLQQVSGLPVPGVQSRED